MLVCQHLLRGGVANLLGQFGYFLLYIFVLGFFVASYDQFFFLLHNFRHRSILVNEKLVHLIA